MKITELKSELDGLSLEELKALRDHARKKISKIRLKKRTVFTVYIPAEYREYVEQAVQWAYQNGLIKHPTKWSFCKLAITNLTDLITKKIMEERVARIRAEQVSEKLTPDSEAVQGGDTPEEPNLTRDQTYQ